MFHHILLICTGNICRSPMAEALLRARLAGTECTVASAGTSALVGYPAEPLAVDVAAAAGLDIAGHRAQQATGTMLAAADLILTMDRTHNSWVNAHFPHLRGRVHKLGRWRHDEDVRDPFRRPRESFEEAFELIQQYAEDWVPRIKG